MANINIDIKRTAAESETLKSIEKDVRAASRIAESVSKALNDSSSDKYFGVCGVLDVISDQVLKEAVKLDSLSDALHYIASTYAGTEKNIAEGLHSKGSIANASASTVLIHSIAMMESLFGWHAEPVPFKAGAAGKTVSREEQKAYDHYLQKKTFELLEEDEFSEKRWKSATKEERKMMLLAFISRLQTLFGLNVPSTIQFTDVNFSGEYDHDTKTLRIDNDLLSGGYEGAMKTAIHEMRHAYQYSAVDDPGSFKVSKESIEYWKNNMKPGNYLDPKDNSWRSYVSQPIEYDAKRFAKQSTIFASPEHRGSWGWKFGEF